MAKILVVDDSAVDREMVGGLLSKASDLTVEFAVHGADALEKMKADLPQLVVTDLMMPEMDGLELVAKVVSEHPFVPVILMTGKGSEEIAVQALQLGASSYVPKAELASSLVDTVENVLQISREEQSQSRLMDCLVGNHCFFELDNDYTMIAPLVNFLHHSIRNVGLCDEATGIRVCVALEEALNNALFHGNLELSSELREGDRVAYRKMIQERQKTAPFCDRSIYVDVRVSRNKGAFVIRDEGPGFDPHDLPDPTDPANLEKTSGRGLLLMRTFMDEVRFNEEGNEVTMIKQLAGRVAGSTKTTKPTDDEATT